MNHVALTINDIHTRQYLLPEEFVPVFFERQEVLNSRTAHYYDCTCYDCTDMHFPCDRGADCDYCESIRQMRDNVLGNNQRWGYTNHLPTVKQEVGGIIGYQAYKAWPHDYTYDYSDLKWSRCPNCDILISGYERDTYHGYCSESCDYNTCADCDCEIPSGHYRCQRCHIAHNTYYCRECGDTEVSRQGAMCEYCAESDDADDDSGYSIGDIVPVKHYRTTENCWIDPNGNVRYVAYCNHDRTAARMGFSGTSECERAGYIHVSIYWETSRPFVYIPQRPTAAQKHTVRLFAEARGVTCPESCAFVIEEERKGILPLTYNVALSCMPRYIREIAYKLSGD